MFRSVDALPEHGRSRRVGVIRVGGSVVRLEQVVVVVRGEVDLRLRPVTERVPLDATADTGAVLLDSSACSFMDSAGLAVLRHAA